MTLTAVLLILAFALLILLPYLPGMRELLRRRDARPLAIDGDYGRDPRFFGQSFREGLEGSSGVQSFPSLVLPSGARLDAVAVSQESGFVGDGGSVRQVYFRRGGRLGAGAQADSVASDGHLSLGRGSRIGQWVDTLGDLTAEPEAQLGVSASATGALELAPGCRFRRLWGHPIRTANAPVQGAKPPERIGSAVVWGRGGMTLPDGIEVARDLVVYGDLKVGAEAVIKGSVRVYGTLELGPWATVEGNVLARKGLRLGQGAKVFGHLYGEGLVDLGAWSQVGSADQPFTVFGRRVTLGPGVEVWGQVVAEHQGRVTA